MAMLVNIARTVEKALGLTNTPVARPDTVAYLGRIPQLGIKADKRA